MDSRAWQRRRASVGHGPGTSVNKVCRTRRARRDGRDTSAMRARTRSLWSRAKSMTVRRYALSRMPSVGGRLYKVARKSGRVSRLIGAGGSTKPVVSSWTRALAAVEAIARTRPRGRAGQSGNEPLATGRRSIRQSYYKHTRGLPSGRCMFRALLSRCAGVCQTRRMPVARTLPLGNPWRALPCT